MLSLHHSLLLAAAWLCILPASAETLLVVRKTDNAVDFMDPGSGSRLASVLTGNAPHEISVSPDGKRAVVSNYGTREQPGSTLSIVDLEQPHETRRIDLAPHTRPHGVAWFAADRIAVTAEGSRHLLILDPDDGRIVSAIETAQETSHMVVVSADARRAYVTNIGSGTTTAIDLVNGRKLEDIATGAGSEALALTPDGRELWVAARADGTVAIVDTSTLGVKARLPLPGVPIRIAMTPDGRTALITCAGAGEIVTFDVGTRVERRRAKVAVPLAPGARRGLSPAWPRAACCRWGSWSRATVAAPTWRPRWATGSPSSTPARSRSCASSTSVANRTAWAARR